MGCIDSAATPFARFTSSSASTIFFRSRRIVRKLCRRRFRARKISLSVTVSPASSGQVSGQVPNNSIDRLVIWDRLSSFYGDAIELPMQSSDRQRWLLQR